MVLYITRVGEYFILLRPKLLKLIFFLIFSSSGKPSQIVIVSKTLTLMSKMMEFMPESELESMFKLGIEYIWAHLDYHIDTVRHLTRNVFQNFIKLAVRFGNKGVSSLIKIILSYLTDLLVNRSTHFIAFNLLAEETGIWFVLQYFNNLPLILLMSLEDPSLAPTVTYFFTVVFAFIKSKFYRFVTLTRI